MLAVLDNFASTKIFGAILAFSYYTSIMLALSTNTEFTEFSGGYFRV